jgi:hypothetical protein
MGRIKKWSKLAGGAGAILLATVGAASAAGVDGGITFSNVATAANGINFARTGTPSRLAVRKAIEAQSPIPNAKWFAQIWPNTPMKPWGIPGVALLDYDNDGDLDIYVTNGPGTPNSLYKNMLKETGKLTFVDVGVSAGVAATSQDSSAVCFGDIDNDGNEDIYVLGAGGPNILYHNNGNGTFNDITAQAGVAAAPGLNPSGCSMGDVNGDGLLDIAVSNTYDDWNQRGPVFGTSVYWPTTQHNLLFMNLGHNNVFSEQGAPRGLHDYTGGIPAGLATYTWSVAAVDFNQDGAVDLVWADSAGGQSGPNAGLDRIFRNDGSGFFTDVTLKAGLNQSNNYGSWMGLSFGDYNCDGYLDFMSTNNGYYLGGPAQDSQWYLGAPGEKFVNPTVGSLKATPFGWGTDTFDFDNDGDQDILWYGDEDVTNLIDTDNPGILLKNTGACTANFTWEKTALGDNRFRQVQGVAVGDLNGDGFEDIVNAATIGIIPVTSPTNRNVLWTTILGMTTGSPFDAVSTAEVVWTGRINTGFMTYIPHSFNPGDMHIEINSANNGNKWAQVHLVGTKGLTSGGHNNLDGFGAMIKFTPAGGKTIRHPVIGGSSYASQDAKIATLGLGSATTGTLEVQWPGAGGGVRNRLYNVKAGEKLVIPEIPCTFDAPTRRAGVADYKACVAQSLAQLVQRHVISGPDSHRLTLSAFQAFKDAHPGLPF